MTTKRSDVEDLLFFIRISRRYHNKRRGFLDAAHRFAATLAIIAGSAATVAALTALGSWAIAAIAVISVIFSVIDVTFGLGEKAALHGELWRRFTSLENEIVSCVNVDANQSAAFRKKRLEIEEQEPPEFRNHVKICFNEQLEADGSDNQEKYHLSWTQRFFSQLIDIKSSDRQVRADILPNATSDFEE